MENHLSLIKEEVCEYIQVIAHVSQCEVLRKFTVSITVLILMMKHINMQNQRDWMQRIVQNVLMEKSFNSK